MWASARMVMMNTKGFALQSSSRSHEVWIRRKTTHAGIEIPWLGVLKKEMEK